MYGTGTKTFSNTAIFTSRNATKVSINFLIHSFVWITIMNISYAFFHVSKAHPQRLLSSFMLALWFQIGWPQVRLGVPGPWPGLCSGSNPFHDQDKLSGRCRLVLKERQARQVCSRIARIYPLSIIATRRVNKCTMIPYGNTCFRFPDT